MSIKDVFENSRSQSIESLEFFSFLTKFYFSLLEKSETENKQIEEFIDVIGKDYYWQSFKNKNYIRSLKDYVFWQSKEIYLENMKKFVSHQCSGSDFATTVYFLIRNDLDQCECLIEDFEKQATLELNPKIFQFSKIISDFEFILEDFALQQTTNLTEDELRQIVKNVLLKIQKYFIDEI
jgi:hypothetical protein